MKVSVLRRWQWMIGLFFLVLGVVGCTAGNGVSPLGSSPVPTPIEHPALTTADLDAGKGAIVGQIANPRPSWAGAAEVRVYASPFYPTENEETGIYILEPSIHPSVVMLADGYFQLVNIDPGAYVLIVGPNPEEASPVMRSNGTAEIFRVTEGQILDVGSVRLNP